MKLFHHAKDGGDESNVDGYWLIEAKGLFSIVLLRFRAGSREAYHTHAFNAVSWIIRGRMLEFVLDGETVELKPSIKPLYTPRDRFHRVYGIAKNTWAVSFRGPWVNTLKEFLPKVQKYIILTHGREII